MFGPRQLVDHDDVELWQLDRFVTRVKSTAKGKAVSHAIIDGAHGTEEVRVVCGPLSARRRFPQFELTRR